MVSHDTLTITIGAQTPTNGIQRKDKGGSIFSVSARVWEGLGEGLEFPFPDIPQTSGADQLYRSGHLGSYPLPAKNERERE